MIRIMQKRDLIQVMAIERQTFSHPWSIQSFTDAYAREDTVYLVSEEDGEVCGYLGIWCAAEDGDLCNLAVQAGRRRGGLASRLLSDGIRQAKDLGVRRILLEVRPSNIPARKLYERFGFTEIGLRRHYYTNPTEDAVIMEYSVPH